MRLRYDKIPHEMDDFIECDYPFELEDKDYENIGRHRYGIPAKGKYKDHLQSRDIKRKIDHKHIENNINPRIIHEISHRIHNLLYEDIKPDIELVKTTILDMYQRMKDERWLEQLTNHGREREDDVYQKWMKGFAIIEVFKPAIAHMFNVGVENLTMIGDDYDKFRKSSKPDMKVTLSNGVPIHLEIQSAFHDGKNHDLKKSKYIQGKERLIEDEINTIVIHIDVYRFRVAFINIRELISENILWENRDEMESKEVFPIPEESFVWRFLEPVPDLSHILLK